MGRRLQLREVTNEERQAVKRLAHSRTASARAVERARVVQAALEGQMVEEIAADQRLSRNTVYVWMHRFEKRGRLGGSEPHWTPQDLSRRAGGRDRGNSPHEAQDIGLAFRLVDARPVGVLPC